MSRRHALVIGNSIYDDQTLAGLKTPEADAQALATALRDAKIGSFDEVAEMINQPEASVRRAISTFFLQKKSDDLLLLYFSGHGVLDAQGRLFLAVKDTQRDLLNATAIPASFITDEMDACRSKRQILILDCCHSGAFAKGTKGDIRAVTATTFEGNGYGRVVLTASDSTQYALEGDQVVQQASLSLFTHYLLDGLTTGEADLAQDGLITLDEWYDYAYDRVVSETPEQTPRKWVYNQQGELIIAHNPNPKKAEPVDLPEELKLAIGSPFVGVRADAVEELKRLLDGGNPALAQIAHQALQQLALQDDSKRIIEAARQALDKYDQEHPLLAEELEQESLAPEALEVEQEQLAEEQQAKEKAQAERLEQERLEAERLAAEKAEADRREREQIEAERIAAEKAEAERLARERAKQAEQAEKQRREQEGARERARAAAGGAFFAELSQGQVRSGEEFQVIVNYPPGRDPAPVQISLDDPAGALSFTEVNPLGTVSQRTVVDRKLSVSFRATPNQPVWAGKPKTYPFSVEVKAQSGEAQTLSGEVLVRPSLPMWALPALGIFLCFLASVGLFLIYPRLFPSRTAGNEATATYLAALVGTATSPPPLLQPSDTSPAPATTTIPVIIPTQAVATEAPAAPIGGIVFATNRDGNWEIYLQDNDGNLNRLTHDSGDDSFPVWSPDGSKILFHSDRAGNYDIYVMNPDGSGVKRLTNDSRADTFASWSADGEKIAFQSKREGPKQIYVMNADGSDQTRLTHSEVDEQFPSWSPDGRQILYSSEIHGVLQLSIMNADGSEQRQLTHGAESYSFASWSPDGRWIVAAYATEDKEEIILAELLPEGTLDVTGLTDSPGKDTQPRWSLDGKYIYFTSNRNGNFDIYRMDADGSNVVWLLVDPPDEEAPSVFP